MKLSSISRADPNRSKNYFFAYDANGNVTDLVDTNGASVAHYEYDPYGNVRFASGTLGATNAFRFSTKYADDETGLVMYPARPYSPTLGRFLSRDPIEEQGGVNLFLFVANAPINSIDPLGQAAFSLPWNNTFVYPVGGPANSGNLAPVGTYVSQFLTKCGVTFTYTTKVVNNSYTVVSWTPPILGISIPYDWNTYRMRDNSLLTTPSERHKALSYLISSLGITDPILFMNHDNGLIAEKHEPSSSAKLGVIVLYGDMKSSGWADAKIGRYVVHELLAHYFTGFLHGSAPAGWDTAGITQNLPTGTWDFPECISCEVADWLRAKGATVDPSIICP